jgi:GT2 family glycosyltransferase
MIDLSISVVTFNCAGKLAALLDSIRRHAGGLALEVLVVDNASTDGIEQVMAEHPEVSFIRNPENRYFTAADNQNLARARGRHVVCLNPDTQVTAGALQTLVRYLDEHPDVGAVTPRFAYPDGRPQGSFSRFPTRLWGALEACGVNWVLPWNRVNQAIMPAELDYDPGVEQDAEVLYGACLMVRREVIKRVGLKDERLVHGWDEYDWCRRMARAGWRLRYVPEAVVLHERGASRPHESAGRLAGYHWQGFFRLYRQHYGPAFAAVLRLLHVLWPTVCSRPSRAVLAGLLRPRHRESSIEHLPPNPEP